MTDTDRCDDMCLQLFVFGTDGFYSWQVSCPAIGIDICAQDGVDYDTVEAAERAARFAIAIMSGMRIVNGEEVSCA